MINAIFNIFAVLLGLYIISVIVLVIIQTIIENYNDTKMELNKKAERIVIVAIMIIIFLIGVYFESSSQRRENKIKELVNDSSNIQELKDNLLNEGIFEEI